MVQMCYVYSKESAGKMVISAGTFCESKMSITSAVTLAKNALSESFKKWILLLYCQQKLIKHCINTCD